MAAYDIFQQVFGVSNTAFAIATCTGTQSDLQAKLQTALPGLLSRFGNWELVWGPTVWKVEPENATTGPDNTWFIARSPDAVFEDGRVHDAYVVSIAGTATDYDASVEDLAVNTVADFTAWIASGGTVPPAPPAALAPNGVYFASGTAGAVHTLFNTPAPAGAPGAGNTLPAFIRSLAFTGAADVGRVVFTGGSLGGALAPVLALACVQTQALPAANALAYPFAGPTPGNGALAAAYAAALPPRGADAGYKAWNRNIVNTLDVVPQAWCTDAAVAPAQNLHNIPTLYGPAPFDVSIAVAVAVSHANTSGITYVPLQSSFFTGTPPAAAPTNIDEFLAIAVAQHATEYSNAIGVPLTEALCPSDGDSGEGAMAQKEVILRAPVLSTIARNKGAPVATQ